MSETCERLVGCSCLCELFSFVSRDHRCHLLATFNVALWIIANMFICKIKCLQLSLSTMIWFTINLMQFYCLMLCCVCCTTHGSMSCLSITHWYSVEMAACNKCHKGYLSHSSLVTPNCSAGCDIYWLVWVKRHFHTNMVISHHRGHTNIKNLKNYTCCTHLYTENTSNFASDFGVYLTFKCGVEKNKQFSTSNWLCLGNGMHEIGT